MNQADVLKAYNQYERIELTLAGCQKFETPDLVKFVSNRDLGSCVAYSNIPHGVLTQRIKAEIEYFKPLKQVFKWFTLSTDSPSNLGESLIEEGFIAEEVSSLMVLDLEQADQSKTHCPASELCIEVTDKQGIRDAMLVQKKVWGGDCIAQETSLIRLKEESPNQIHIYVVYQDNKPVSSAWLMSHPDSPFGSIWAGSTLSKYRGKGFYSALLAKRIEDAKAKGLKYLTIQASKMSRPIVANFGFECIAQTRQYRYDPTL